MTMPRARTIDVDARRYRWRVSGGALLVEACEQSRGTIREALLRGEVVTPARVAAVIRHARGGGWSPSEATPWEVAAGDPFSDPRGRDDYQWRKTLRRCLSWFEEHVAAPVEVGAYWWEGPLHYADASMGVHLRWRGPGPIPQAECWDAVMGIGGNAERQHTSVTAFPFANGRLLREGQEQSYCFSLERDGSRVGFDAQGFLHWHGPGEWDGVVKPGDLFDGDRLTATARSGKLWIELSRPAATSELWAAVHAHAHEGQRRIDPVGTPWLGSAPWRVEAPSGTHVVIDLDRWRSSWPTGRHRVALRISGLPFGAGQQSALTDEFELTVDARRVE